MPKDPPSAANLRGRADWLDDQLDDLPNLAGSADMRTDQFRALHAAHRRATDALARRVANLPANWWPARWSGGTSTARLTMMGITTSSTSGQAAAMRSWCDKAHALANKLEKTDA